jgi:hypothetical protein
LRCGVTADGTGFFLADSVTLDLTALGLAVEDEVVLAPEVLLIGVFVASEVFCCAVALIGFFTDDAAFVACPSGLAGVAAFVVVELVDGLLGMALAADEDGFGALAALDADTGGLTGVGFDFFVTAGLDGVADIFDDVVLADVFGGSWLAGGSLSTRSIFGMSVGDRMAVVEPYMRVNQPGKWLWLNHASTVQITTTRYRIARANTLESKREAAGVQCRSKRGVSK